MEIERRRSSSQGQNDRWGKSRELGKESGDQCNDSKRLGNAWGTKVEPKGPAGTSSRRSRLGAESKHFSEEVVWGSPAKWGSSRSGLKAGDLLENLGNGQSRG
jgi:hypothetical protein